MRCTTLSANLIRYLDEWALGSPDKPALITPIDLVASSHQTVTFGDLAARVSGLAAGLAARGIGLGDRVVVMVPMSQELYLTILALLKLGAIIVFIDPWVGVRQMRACAALCEPKAFVAPPLVLAIATTIPEFRRIPLKIAARGGFPGAMTLKSLIAEQGAIATAVVEAETTALITFTTGSSGVPKGANRTHGFLEAQHHALGHHMGHTPDDVDMPALPIFILHDLASGITSVVPAMKPSRPADVDAAAIVRQIRQFNVTTMVGSPAYFDPIARHLEAVGATLPTIRAVFTGGGTVPPGLLGRLVPVLPNGTAFVGYGSTEAEPVALIAAQEVVNETGAMTQSGRGTCVGRIADGLEARIIRVIDGAIETVDGIELPIGEIGEILVRGPHVNRDYYRNPEATRQNKIPDGEGEVWHRMGDLGYFDEKDRLWVVGRLHNRVMRDGKALYPIMVEALAARAAWVRRAALVGLPDATLGQRAVLVLEAQGAPRLEEIRAALSGAGFTIDRIVIRRRLPVDPRHNTKIDYAKLARTLGG